MFYLVLTLSNITFNFSIRFFSIRLWRKLEKPGKTYTATGWTYEERKVLAGDPKLKPFCCFAQLLSVPSNLSVLSRLYKTVIISKDEGNRRTYLRCSIKVTVILAQNYSNKKNVQKSQKDVCILRMCALNAALTIKLKIQQNFIYPNGAIERAESTLYRE